MSRPFFLTLLAALFLQSPLAAQDQPPAKGKEAELLEKARQHLCTVQLQRAGALYQKDPMQALKLLNDPDACPTDLRDFTWHYLHNACKAWEPVKLATEGVFDQVAFSPDGKFLALGGSFKCIVWDFQNGKVDKSFPRGGSAGVVFHPDGKSLFVGDVVWGASLCDLGLKDPGPVKLEIKPEPVGSWGKLTSLALSGNGKLLAGGFAEKWKMIQGVLKGGKNTQVQVLDVKTRQIVFSFPIPVAETLAITFSPDSKLLAAGGMEFLDPEGDKGFSCMVKFWDVTTGAEKKTIKIPNHDVMALAFSPDGKTLAAGGAEAVKLIDVSTGQCKTTLKGHVWTVDSVAYSPDGRMIASADLGNTVKLWDATTFQVITTLRRGGSAVAFSPDNRKLAAAAGSQKGGRLWDVEKGMNLAKTSWRTKKLNFAAFGPQGQIIAAIPGKDGKELLIDVTTGKPGQVEIQDLQKVPDEGTTKVTSPDGKILAEKNGNAPAEILLRDAKTKQKLFALRGHTEIIKSLAFSPDGKTLASGSTDRTVRLWHVASGQERAVFQMNNDAVVGLAFNVDGKILLGIGQLDDDPDNDFEVISWDGSPGKK